MKFLYLNFVLVLALTLCAFAAIATQAPLFADAERYTFYIGNTSLDFKQVETTDCPTLYQLVLSNVNGQAAEYDSDVDVNALLAKYNATVLFTEELSDSVNYYCKADLPYSIMLYGTEINLHVCVRKDKVLVASPILFGGY